MGEGGIVAPVTGRHALFETHLTFSVFAILRLVCGSHAAPLRERAQGERVVGGQGGDGTEGCGQCDSECGCAWFHDGYLVAGNGTVSGQASLRHASRIVRLTLLRHWSTAKGFPYTLAE